MDMVRLIGVALGASKFTVWMIERSPETSRISHLEFAAMTAGTR